MDKPLEFNYDNVVIGSSLEAILFAHFNRYHIIWTKNESPYPFELLEEDFGLGQNKYDIWTRHAFLLGIGGFCPFNDNIQNIYILDGNRLRLAGQQGYKYFINYKQIHVFNDHNLHGLPLPVGKYNKDVKIIDWFRTDRINLMSLEDHYRRKNRMFKETYLYYKSQNKRVISFSYCTEKQLEKDELPIYLLRRRMQEYLLDLGAPSHRRDKAVIHEDREIIHLGRDRYEDTESIKFNYETVRDMWRNYPKRVFDYTRYFYEKLGI